ncbi:MAG: hypothetical protein JAY74_03145, partial [Candidatus Thiodiazotropha taylori]|nr:hypothetical protein [Candidatus Thiodiazotropha taylori]
MTTITNYQVNAELALAAYSDLSAGMSEPDYIIALMNNERGMSWTQANNFASNWYALDQYDGQVEEFYIDEFGQEHTFLNPTGLNVTLFEHVTTGEQVVAVRGTEPTDLGDVFTDIIDIGFLGAAERQSQYAALSTKVREWLDSGILQPGFTVTGHSLGGFLSTNLAIDYSGDIDHTYLYNAPGVTGVTGGILQAIHNALSPDNEIGIPNVLPISNVMAIGDVVSSVGMYVSSPLLVNVETRSPLGAHSMVRVTDALAIYNLFYSIDDNETLSDLTPILSAASNTGNETLEVLIFRLSDLLMHPINVQIDNRDALYQAIYSIEAEIYVDRMVAGPQLKPPFHNLHVESLSNLTREQIITHANDDIAYRYALTHLNPFVITGQDLIYEDHNQNGELDLFDPLAQAGELTQAYLQDRTYFLQAVMQRNEQNVQSLTATTGHGELYWDATAGQFMSIPEAGTTFGVDVDSMVNYRFGGEDDETNGELDGRNNNDHIYGGGGNDTLNGNAGNDYLEGNSGIDILNGGVGDDALYGNSGNDILNGGENRDLLVGGLGKDTLNGDDGIDVLTGDIGLIDSDRRTVELRDDREVDILRGGEGDDLYFAGVGDIINDSDGRGNVCVSMTLRDGSQEYVQLGLYNIRGTSDPNIYIEHNAYHDLDI